MFSGCEAVRIGLEVQIVAAFEAAPVLRRITELGALG
jgi:hypothetical protein